MKSMTGYGYIETLEENFQASVEIKSYNNRYSEVSVGLPSFLQPLEPRVKQFLSDAVGRGKVDVYVRFRELEEPVDIHLDESGVKAYSVAFEKLAELTGLTEAPRISDFLMVEGLLKPVKHRDLDSYWDKLSPLFEAARERWEETRVVEGAKTQDDVLGHIASIEAARELFTSYAGELESRIKDGLKEKFEAVLGQEIDENRILAETAMLLVKYSINEEIQRLGAHLERFREYAASEGPVGKKLDFLCQEINREINTIGSKSVILEVNQAVVEAKDALENVREQLRNVE